MALLKSGIIYPLVRYNVISKLVLLLLIVPTGLSAQESTHLAQSPNQDSVKQDTAVSDQSTMRSQSKKSVEDYIQLNQAPPGEKVYLHLDRPDYMQGDTVWFKAYSWYGYDQVPDTVSGILYVDLINAEGKVKLKRKLLIPNGSSHGDFCLDSTIGPGTYTLRACTRLMQNVNTGEPFYRTITINKIHQNFQVNCTPVILKQAGNDSLQVSFRFFEIDQTGDLKKTSSHEVNYSLKAGDQLLHAGNVQAANSKEQVFRCSLSGISGKDSVAVLGISIQDERLTFEKQFRIPLQEGIDVQFFPEGGKLVNGLESKVAFKAIGTDGLSRQVKGEILDGDEKAVTGFGSSHKGMGSFLLKPEAGKKYFAHIWHNNRKYVIPLPPVSAEGCVMSVTLTGIGNDPYLTLKCSPSEINTQKYVVGTAYGKIWFSALVKTVKDSCRLRIPAEMLPEGICRLTVMNSIFEPQCERLIFVDKNLRFKIEVKPDSSSYGTRSKVTLLIKTTGADGVPVQADLSLAVVDKEQIIGNGDTGGISSYKLLESELQGYIEDAGFYFKDDSCTNHDVLDLLLLTQGYRKFLPGNTNPDGQKFQPEKSFDISGKIKINGSKSRERKFNYSDIGLRLMCRSGGLYLDQSNPDSLGRFRFQIPLLYGKSHSILQASTSKGKSFYGEIYLDESVPAPKFNLPMTKSYNITTPAVEYVNRLQAVTKTEVSKITMKGAWLIKLPEVKITAKAKNWYRDFEKEAIKIVNLDSLDPNGIRYKNIYELLIQEFGATEYIIQPHYIKTIQLPAVGSAKYGQHFPIYVINGETYFDAAEDTVMFVHLLSSLSALYVNEIKRLMVLPPGNIASYYADDLLKVGLSQSLVVIETYSNNFYRGDPEGIKTFILDGLDAPRAFYSPSYEGPSKNNPIYDGRATLYWEPSLITDTDGQAKIEFFTGDRQTGLEVIVNGIEVWSGNPGQGKALIKVN